MTSLSLLDEQGRRCCITCAHATCSVGASVETLKGVVPVPGWGQRHMALYSEACSQSFWAAYQNAARDRAER